VVGLLNSTVWIFVPRPVWIPDRILKYREPFMFLPLDASTLEEKKDKMSWIISKCRILKKGKPSGFVPVSRHKSPMA
jgi:hypothetical protein